MRCIAFIGIMLAAVSLAGAGEVLHVNDSHTLRLAKDALRSGKDVSEIIIAEGTYFGSFSVHRPKDVDYSKRPLLIRAADGAKVVFEGSVAMDEWTPHDQFPGVFVTKYTSNRTESPRVWEPKIRVRYRLVADAASVAHFPASYVFDNGQLIVHPADGKKPEKGAIRVSALDYGMFIARPYVTVRGIHFRDYRVREKWSTGVSMRVDHLTVEDCSSTNTSLGFTANGKNNVIRRCRVDDSGGGIYVQGENVTVEDCRLFKIRDRFMVPMYDQDDTGIQFYYPAKGGTIRGNLAVGYAKGIFIKAHSAPYVVEHNTLVGDNVGYGFGATKWHPGERFRFNIVTGFARPIEFRKTDGPQHVDYNCYWGKTATDRKPIGAHDIVADPKFFAPGWEDYRLANDSPCLAIADDGDPAGAFPAVGDAKLTLGEPREWHVSMDGRDGRSGDLSEPLQTIQHAVDRAKPGDTVMVHPGIYPDPIRFRQGGMEGRPITIRSVEKWGAILDSHRQAAKMIDISEAPYVAIHDFEIRWYKSIGINVYKSPNVTIAGCKIWNAHWGGSWPTGSAVRAHYSPGLVAHHNLLFRQEHGFWLYNCPSSKLTHNTCVGNLYSAAAFLYSAVGSTCRNNSFAFQGNDVILIHVRKGEEGNLKKFDCDYNNYATSLRAQAEGVEIQTIKPREEEGFLNFGSKAIGNLTVWKGKMHRVHTMDAWRKLTGLDQHSIFANPLYVNAKGRDFRLSPDSPNIGAGANGSTIGAMQTSPATSLSKSSEN